MFQIQRKVNWIWKKNIDLEISKSNRTILEPVENRYFKDSVESTPIAQPSTFQLPPDTLLFPTIKEKEEEEQYFDTELTPSKTLTPPKTLKATFSTFSKIFTSAFGGELPLLTPSPIVRKEKERETDPKPEPEPFLMSTTTDDTQWGEIKICAPRDFDGDRTKTNRFLRSCELYLKMNTVIYDTNEKKVAFVMSFMNSGGAAAWRDQWFNEYTAIRATFLTWNAFKTAFLVSFTPISDEVAARGQLKALVQDSLMDDYVGKYWELIARSGITQEAAKIEYFMDGLDPEIVKLIYQHKTIPTTIETMITTTTNTYQNLERANVTSKGSRHKKRATMIIAKKKKNRPPITIEIKWLSYEEKGEYMRKGLCFRCGKPGH